MTTKLPERYAGSTPAPWSVEPNVKAGGVTHLAVTNRGNGKDWMVCSITPYDWQRPVDLANASLIADAPALAARVHELEVMLQDVLDDALSDGTALGKVKLVLLKKAETLLAKGQP